MRETFYIY